MRKDKLIELVKLNLGGGDVSVPVQSRYDPREIALVIDMVYNDLIYALYEAEKAKGNTSMDALDPFGIAYKLQLQEDTDRKEWYVQLPFQMIPIPSSLGIRLVSPYTDQNSAYDIIDNNSLHTFSRLANQLLRPQVICYIEMPRIYFRYLPTDKPEHIMVKAISDFESLEDDAEVIIPGGNEVLFNRVADIFRRKGVKTLYNSNSDKQV